MPSISTQPKKLVQSGGEGFKILWGDDHESFYPANYLRSFCPCAVCVNELTGEKQIDPESVPRDLRLMDAQLTGNYAVRFQFSDGHGTGIYGFESLRRICPCPVCTSKG